MSVDWKAIQKEITHGHYRAQCGALVALACLSVMAALFFTFGIDLDNDVNPLPTILKGFACLAICILCCYLYVQLKIQHEPKKDDHADPTKLE